MFELIVTIILLLCVSFLCSILESVILSVTRPYIQVLIQKSSKSGKLLQKYKEDIDQPIAAILTLNTISHTVGAAVSGALALKIFGSNKMAAFSAILTLLILIFSEIIPKTIGAQYWKRLAPITAFTLKIMIILLKPLIVPIQLLTSILSKGNPGALISKAEIYNFVKIGYKQGVLDKQEIKIAENLFKLRETQAKDIITPRTVVFWLEPTLTVTDLHKNKTQLQFSRIVLYNAKDNTVQGVVLRRDIMDRIAKNKTKAQLKTFSMKPFYVPESITVLKLLNSLVAEQVHLAIVLNEYGDYSGIITIEDAIEALLGTEIVDEFDPAVDMKQLAKKAKKKT